MAYVLHRRISGKSVKPRAPHPNTRATTSVHELGGPADPRKLTLEVYPGILIGKKKGNLVTVYTKIPICSPFCSGFVVSPMLCEVTFISESDGKLSGLIVEKEGGCSLYANVEREILSGDFTNLGPEVMLSGIALSLTESILPAEKKSRGRKKG